MGTGAHHKAAAIGGEKTATHGRGFMSGYFIISSSNGAVASAQMM
jgi:hypothetical protein